MSKPSDTPCTRGKSGARRDALQGLAARLRRAMASSPARKRPSASAFSVGYDRNNGRPRYCHVRLKPAHVKVEHTPAPKCLAVVNS